MELVLGSVPLVPCDGGCLAWSLKQYGELWALVPLFCRRGSWQLPEGKSLPQVTRPAVPRLAQHLVD